MVEMENARLLMPQTAHISAQETLAPFTCPKCGGRELCVQVSDTKEVIYTATPAQGVDNLVFVDWETLESDNASRFETFPPAPDFTAGAPAWCDCCDIPLTDVPDAVQASILRLWKAQE